MSRLLLAVFAFVTLTCCIGGEKQQATKETSPTGIQFTLLKLETDVDVSIQVAWPSDWGYRADTNKAAPFVGTQLILAGGAEGYPAGEVGETFADLNSEGLVYGAINDHVIGELTFEIDHLDETIKIANAHLRAPTLDEVWFDRVRNGLAEKMSETQSQPAPASFDASRWAIFGDAPLRNALSLDSPNTFESLARDDIVAWHAETFTRTPSAIVVAGDISAADAGAAIDTLFEGLPDKGPDIVRDVALDTTPRRILLHLPDAETTTLSFIGLLPPTRDGNEMEDMILVQALGGSDQSVLFEAVRRDLRASYGFGAGISNYTRLHRVLFMSGEVDGAKLAEAEEVIRAAYDTFRATGPSGALKDRKAPFEENFAELPEFVVDIGRTEIQAALDGWEAGTSLRLNDLLDAVTEDTIKARLSDVYPTSDDFLVFAVSADAEAMPGACVIKAPRDAANCP